MIFSVCYLCLGKNKSCGKCSNSTDLFKALKTHIGPDQVVVGDPSSFNRGGFEKGWDLESKAVSGPVLVEYEDEWKNKIVKNTITGNMVKVGSLPPDLQDKYRPDNEKERKNPFNDQRFTKDGQKYKVVAGGVVINKNITPADFKSRTETMRPTSSLAVKKWNSKFDIYTDDKGVNHLYMSTYDQDEFDGGMMTPERANTVRHVGAFKTPADAKKYVLGDNEKMDLDQTKRVTLARQTPWSNKDMGI